MATKQQPNSGGELQTQPQFQAGTSDTGYGGKFGASTELHTVGQVPSSVPSSNLPLGDYNVMQAQVQQGGQPYGMVQEQPDQMVMMTQVATGPQQQQELVEGNAASAGGGQTGAQMGYDSCEYMYICMCHSGLHCHIAECRSRRMYTCMCDDHYRAICLTIITYRHNFTCDVPYQFCTSHCSSQIMACPVLHSLKQNKPLSLATLHSLLSMTTASGRAHSTLLVEISRASSIDSRNWNRLVPLGGKGQSL